MGIVPQRSGIGLNQVEVRASIEEAEVIAVEDDPAAGCPIGVRREQLPLGQLRLRAAVDRRNIGAPILQRLAAPMERVEVGAPPN